MKNINKKSLCLAVVGALASANLLADTEFSYSGYIKMDTMISDYSDGESNPLNRDFYVPSLIPVSDGSASSSGKEWDMHARQSRIIFGTKTNLDNGSTIGTRVEMDFQVTSGGDERISNSYSPRIRQAYFTYDNLLFGQAWTTFMNLSALPESLDFIGNTDGTVFARQTQIRYTNGGFQFAVENPETTISNYQVGGRVVTDDNAMPDLVFRYNWKGDWGGLSAAIITRQLECNDATTGCDSTESSIGLSFGGKVNVGDKNDVRFVVNSGSGIGRYIGLNIVNDGVFNASGEIEAIDITAYSVAYRHQWNDQWRSNIIYAGFEADNDVTLTGLGATESTNSFRINLLHSPTKNLTFGIELAHAERETEAGFGGDMDRLQFSAKYAF
ncbi:DcaP family trimeric outer membrane transporter [Pleionea litopenaei]|uniref:DcaP family trimeric outer membrane transporter n=1 Tax=Pleionea litopenaei TaxID=3070815 RepID=A0AA51X7S0_9GAMM|nr:DcaP family trimeric outer membrane transporter [Pleionea sp. HL-JVS1]WMS88194.1 DcaP family trimeric outer membrane transporter [Pleionea sp. HL-JVS1]